MVPMNSYSSSRVSIIEWARGPRSRCLIDLAATVCTVFAFDSQSCCHHRDCLRSHSEFLYVPPSGTAARNDTCSRSGGQYTITVRKMLPTPHCCPTRAQDCDTTSRTVHGTPYRKQLHNNGLGSGPCSQGSYHLELLVIAGHYTLK